MGHILLYGHAIQFKECRRHLPTRHDGNILWHDPHWYGGIRWWHSREIKNMRWAPPSFGENPPTILRTQSQDESQKVRLWSFLGQTFRIYCQQERDRDRPKQSKSHCWNATSQESQRAKRINRATTIHKKIYISALSKMSTLLWTSKRRSSFRLEWQVPTGF